MSVTHYCFANSFFFFFSPSCWECLPKLGLSIKIFLGSFSELLFELCGGVSSDRRSFQRYKLNLQRIQRRTLIFVSMYWHNFIIVVRERFVELRNIPTIYKPFKCMFLVNIKLTSRDLKTALENSEY